MQARHTCGECLLTIEPTFIQMDPEMTRGSSVTKTGDEPPHFDPRNEDVDWRAVRITLDHIGHKWHPSILDELLTDSPQRFSELEDRLNGISSATLSNSLEGLQEKELVDRKVLETKPVRVEYEITERGQSLESVINSLKQWGKTHVCTKQLIQNKYHPEIIRLLFINEQLYFSDLKETIGLTNRTLSDSLERLQEANIVQRTVVDSKPVRVEYSLTERGKSIIPVFESLSIWGRRVGDKDS